MRSISPSAPSAEAAGALDAAEPRCLLLLAGKKASLGGLVAEWNRAGARVGVAHDGNHAVDLLVAEPFDLFVVDGDVPGLVELLLVIRTDSRSRSIPCLVLAPHSPTSLEQRVLGQAGIAIVSLAGSPAVEVQRALEAGAGIAASASRGSVPVPALCELLAILKKTCTIDLAAKGKVGSISILGGRLVGALTGEAEGLEAARAMLGWQEPAIEIRDRCPMGMRRLDEDLHDLVVRTLGRSASIEHELFHVPEPGSSRLGSLSTEGIMVALESYLDEFKTVKGYIASGIMDFTGETLAVHSVNPGVKLETVGAVFNDIFRGAHEASKKIGLDACNTLVMTTPKGIVVMECSGASKNPHLHAIAILEEGGNQALAKMTMSRILPLAVKDFS